MQEYQIVFVDAGGLETSERVFEMANSAVEAYAAACNINVEDIAPAELIRNIDGSVFVGNRDDSVIVVTSTAH